MQIACRPWDNTLPWSCHQLPDDARRARCAPSSVVLFHETAEKVRAGISKPVSRQHICFDRRSEGRSVAVWTSRFCVDRIAAGEIDFVSGLPQQRHAAPAACEAPRREPRRRAPAVSSGESQSEWSTGRPGPVMMSGYGQGPERAG